jgi:hypothetical protein
MKTFLDVLIVLCRIATLILSIASIVLILRDWNTDSAAD